MKYGFPVFCVLLFIIFSSCSSARFIARSAKGLTRDAALKNAHVGMLVYDAVTKENIYGESVDKSFHPPVLTPCRIERGNYVNTSGDEGTDTKRTVVVWFFKPHLIERNLFTERGDVLLWNEEYYQIDEIDENQLLAGKDPEYAYKSGSGVEDRGMSLSIKVTAHYTNPETVGLKEERI